MTQAVETKPLSAFDPKADDFMDDPYPFYHRLRREAPVYHDEKSGIVFIAGYDIVEQVMKDPVSFSSLIDRAGMRKGGLPDAVAEIRKEAWPIALTMSQNDGPSHDMFRDLVAHFFVPANLKTLEPFIRSRTEVLFTNLRNKGTADFLTEFAVPLPISVIGHYLGLEQYGYGMLKRWSDAFADEIGFLTSDERAIEIAQLCLDCHKAMVAVCDDRRFAPRDDIISHLATVTIEDGRPLSIPELLSILTQLLVAGNETTTNTLAGGMRRLATDPQLFGILKQDPAKITRFIEEVLRLESPVQGQFRQATADTDLAGIPIPKGTLLHVRLASANRDETVFGDEAVRVHLDRRHPRPHVAFGMGLHFCVGAMLSRLELKIAFDHLVTHFNSVQLAVPESDLHYHTHFHLRGLTALPIRLA